MNLVKITIAGCFVLACANFAAADEVRIDTGRSDAVHVDHAHPPVVRHDDAWWRRHHHHDEHHDDAHVDINVGH
jgi:hypothetical protein